MRRYGGALANVNDSSGESESHSSLTRVTKGAGFSARALHGASRGHHGRFIPAPHDDPSVWQGRSRVGILAGARSFRACRWRSSVHGALALAGRHMDRLDRAVGVVAGGSVRRECRPRWAAGPTHRVGGAGIRLTAASHTPVVVPSCARSAWTWVPIRPRQVTAAARAS